MPLLQLFHRHSQRTGDRVGIGLNIERLAQVHDHHLVAVIHHLLELVCSDPRNTQFPQQELPVDIFVGDIQGQGAYDQRDERAAETGRLRCNLLDLVTEQIPRSDVGHGPEECAEAIVEQEPRDAHAEQPSESWRHGTQPRNEVGDDERPHPVSAEKGLRSTYARVRLERDTAEHV